MDNQYKLLEERYKLLEERYKLLEERYKILEEKQKDISEKRRKAVNARWAKAKKNASKDVSHPEACNLSDSARNEPVDASKSILGIEQRLDSLSRVVAWQQEEDKRARAFETNLYRDEEAPRDNVEAPTNEEQVFEYMHSYTMGASFIDARDEARRFMDYYMANGWTMGQAPMRDWRAAARNWINKVTKHLDKQKQREYEAAKTYAETVRGIHEDAEERRRFAEIADRYW